MLRLLKSRFFCTKIPAPFEEVLTSSHTFPFKKLLVDSAGSSLLTDLKTAAPVDISTNGTCIQALTVDTEVPEGASIMPNTLYIRDFYDRLFNMIRRNMHTILVGNPGISKSWYQWYMLYRLVNEQSLGPNHLGNNSSPKVIIWQTGMEAMTFYFPQICKAYVTYNVRHCVNAFRPDKALYLFEPSTSLVEPYITAGVQTTITCSPDRRRYHEFFKREAEKYYMPCWNLPELQLVGCHIAEKCDPEMKDLFEPEKIKERFNEFGGIFRCVLPSSKYKLLKARRAQADALDNVKSVRLFLPGNDIEKTDETHRNISPLILQYAIDYGGENEGEEDEFKKFTMRPVSRKVNQKMMHLSDDELYKAAHQLRLMCMGAQRRLFQLFEVVVYNSLTKNTFDWEVYNGEEWVNHVWNLKDMELSDKGQENVKNMKPSVLYYPVDHQFPAIDFVFIKEEQTGQKKHVFLRSSNFWKNARQDRPGV